jgi:hypothetical protein
MKYSLKAGDESEIEQQVLWIQVFSDTTVATAGHQWMSQETTVRSIELHMARTSYLHAWIQSSPLSSSFSFYSRQTMLTVCQEPKPSRIKRDDLPYSATVLYLHEPSPCVVCEPLSKCTRQTMRIVECLGAYITSSRLSILSNPIIYIR